MLSSNVELIGASSLERASNMVEVGTASISVRAIEVTSVLINSSGTVDEVGVESKSLTSVVVIISLTNEDIELSPPAMVVEFSRTSEGMKAL